MSVLFDLKARRLAQEAQKRVHGSFDQYQKIAIIQVAIREGMDFAALSSPSPAQADHDRRILAALEPTPPSPEADGSVVAELLAAYEKVKLWPEKQADGFMNLVALRNLVPEAAAALASLSQQLADERAKAERLARDLRTVQNAAKTIASAHGTELEHLRQNRTYDHKLRAEHESLIERDAQMTDALLAAEAKAEQLTAQLREAQEDERDADRYRYLRDNCTRRWTSNMGGPDSLDIGFDADGHDLNVAIDARLAARASAAKDGDLAEQDQGKERP